MPSISAFVIAIVIVYGAFVASARIEWLSTFVFGAASGATTVLFLRQLIVAASPSLATSTAFDYYWLFALIIAALVGLLAVKMMCGRNSMVHLARLAALALNQGSCVFSDNAFQGDWVEYVWNLKGYKQSVLQLTVRP